MNYEELIIKNGCLQIDTLLRFEGDNTRVFSFLCLAEKANCTVIFSNENIVIDPKEKKNTETNLLISFYNEMYQNPEILKNYISGLCMINEEWRWAR